MAKYYFRLNTKDINDVIRMMDLFNNDLVRKCEQFVDALADVGIQTAQWNLFALADGDEMLSVADKVTFNKQVNLVQDGATCIIIPASQPFEVVWKNRSAMVDPLLMSEFGSGMFAGDYQGTFPNQTHAFDPNGWYWVGTDDKKHHSTGISPTRPIYKAYEEMKLQIKTVASQVFT